MQAAPDPVAASVSVAEPVAGAPVAPQAALSSPAAQPPSEAPPPAQGLVSLAISPWGEVFEGGRSLGVTPPMVQISLPAGRHVLTLRNGDAPPVNKTVDVVPGVSVKIQHHF